MEMEGVIMSTAVRTDLDRRHSPVGWRAVGYAAAVAFNALLLLLINGWPGWQSLSFLTPQADSVVGLVNTSLVFGILLNLCYLVSDPEWLKGLGDAVSAAFATAILVALIRTWPFILPNEGVEVGLRIGLIFAAVGSAIAVIAGIVRFAKAALSLDGHQGGSA